MRLSRPLHFLLAGTLSFACSAQVPQGDSCTVSIETIYCCAELFITRDWLLPMLMNGQVTVGAAEEKVGLAMAAEAAGKYERKKR